MDPIWTPSPQRVAAANLTRFIARVNARRGLALEMFGKLRARLASAGPPPLGLHLIMGPEAPQKLANMVAALEAGLVAPIEMIACRS